MNFSKSSLIGTLTVVLAAFTLNGLAFAGEKLKAEEMEKPAFEELDANIDGVISENEAQDTWLASVFDDVDLDRNGLVTRSEYEQAIS